MNAADKQLGQTQNHQELEQVGDDRYVKRLNMPEHDAEADLYPDIPDRFRKINELRSATPDTNGAPHYDAPMLGFYPPDEVTRHTFDFSSDKLDPFWEISDQLFGEVGQNSLRQMNPRNVFIRDGCLVIRVPGGQQASTAAIPVSSGQIKGLVEFQDGTIEMVARLSDVPGTCQSMFTYKSDTNEVDLEFTNPKGTLTTHAVVQALQRYGPVQQQDFDGSALADDFHTYKVGKVQNAAYYFIDKNQIYEYTQNIPPNSSSPYISNWSNGNIDWTAGPPVNDSELIIKNITIEYAGDSTVLTASSTASTTATATSTSTGSAATSSHKNLAVHNVDAALMNAIYGFAVGYTAQKLAFTSR